MAAQKKSGLFRSGLISALLFLLALLSPETPEAQRQPVSPGFSALPPFPSAPYDFTINTFFAEIEIGKDSGLTVRERIDVTFHRPRHGIYRDIPFRYRDEPGRSRTTPLEVLAVTDLQGRPRPYTVERQGPRIHIRIGDPHTYVEGSQSYLITYRVKNVLLFFPDHDELYWNITGNEWAVPILEAGAVLRLKGMASPGDLRGACYTGGPGAREQECGWELQSEGAVFRTRRKLGPGQGLTVVLGWNPGSVRPPSSWEKLSWALNLQENVVFIFPLLAFLFMVRHWRNKGRDPRVPETVVVRYEPPRYGDRVLAPGEVGALLDERLDPRDITGSVIGLAVAGFIQINEIKKEGWIFDSTEYEMVRLKEADASLIPFERELLERLFETGPRILVEDLKNKFYKNLDPLGDILYQGLQQKHFFREPPDIIRNRYRYVGLATAGLGVAVMIFSGSHWRIGLALALCGLPLILFSPVMPAKTKAGALARREVEGFLEFLRRAEKDRLERMNDPHLFSRYLPYAVALDVAHNWARSFEGLFQEAPTWYGVSGSPHRFSPSGFSQSLDRVAAGLTSALASSPRGGSGGGFGGGGSSGGGFGGGGGGSW